MSGDMVSWTRGTVMEGKNSLVHRIIDPELVPGLFSVFKSRNNGDVSKSRLTAGT